MPSKAFPNYAIKSSQKYQILKGDLTIFICLNLINPWLSVIYYDLQINSQHRHIKNDQAFVQFLVTMCDDKINTYVSFFSKVLSVPGRKLKFDSQICLLSESTQILNINE